MQDEKIYRILLFDGTNFQNWKYRIEVLLQENDLIEYKLQNQQYKTRKRIKNVSI